MIARCPQCQARFRLAPDKVGPQGARIRCSKCQTIFRVSHEGENTESESTPAAAAPKPSQPARPARSTAPAAPAVRPAPRGPRILVAESDADAAKKVVETLGRFGLCGEVVHDGGEALLWIYRNKPPAAVLGGHLPSVTAPVVAELIRRTAELKHVRLIRIAPLDEPVGAPEFEADQTIEPGEIEHGMEAALEALELGLRPSAGRTPATTGERPAVAERSTPTPAGSRPQPASSPGSSDPEVAAAERLARIIVSDIVLYNQEKFQAAARSGNVAEALEAELTEASGLFRQRVPEEIRANRDFLIEELERRARRAG